MSKMNKAENVTEQYQNFENIKNKQGAIDIPKELGLFVSKKQNP